MVSSTVTFEVTADGEPVTDADIFINGQKTDAYQHQFNQAQTATAIAKKDGYKDSEPLTITVNVMQSDVDIYVLGEGYHEQLQGIWPMYWKNGEPMPLLLAPNHMEDPVIYHSIAVSGHDVYITGERIFSSSRASAFFWKNNTYHELTQPSGYAKGLDISLADDDVYVAGVQKNANNLIDIAYWKNGGELPVRLDSGTIGQTGESFIKVIGDDVHVAGILDAEPTYWKNGVATPLEGTGVVTGIAVSDHGDVYISGYGSNGNRTIAKYWKNGQEVILGTGELESESSSIFVEDDDVYVAGYEKVLHKSGQGRVNVARYWKNGEAVDLTDRSYPAEASGIFVLDGNVYVSGIESLPDQKVSATYWHNSQPVRLSNKDHNGQAGDIFVVKKNP
ncbi:hypothetical protein [Salegentibacter salinarum]|nr:hypothetical protein [Salegentibacter salinarum]